jgi:hypothetical protein
MAGDDEATMVLRDAQLLLGYPDSPLGDEDCDAAAPGLRPGRRAPDARGLRREGVAFELRLFELLSTPDPVLLLSCPASVDGLKALAQDAREAARRRLAVYAILAPGVDAGRLRAYLGRLFRPA